MSSVLWPVPGIKADRLQAARIASSILARTAHVNSRNLKGEIMEALETRFIRLSGGVGEIVHQRIEKRFASSSLVEMVQQFGGMNTGLLPYDCVFMKEGKFEEGSRTGNLGAAFRLHICVDRPRILGFRFQGLDVGEKGDHGEEDKVRTFALAMPWLVTFVLYINNGMSQVRLAAVLETNGLAMRGLDTPLFQIPLPNISANTGVFCLGEFKMDSSKPFWDRTNMVREYIRESVWNNDLFPLMGKTNQSVPNVTSLKHWAEETDKTGPAFWRSLKLQPLGSNLDKMIGAMTT
jgi:hypothetical protein